jgi:hypothetical protein
MEMGRQQVVLFRLDLGTGQAATLEMTLKDTVFFLSIIIWTDDLELKILGFFWKLSFLLVLIFMKLSNCGHSMQ